MTVTYNFALEFAWDFIFGFEFQKRKEIILLIQTSDIKHFDIKNPTSTIISLNYFLSAIVYEVSELTSVQSNLVSDKFHSTVLDIVISCTSLFCWF